MISYLFRRLGSAIIVVATVLVALAFRLMDLEAELLESLLRYEQKAAAYGLNGG